MKKTLNLQDKKMKLIVESSVQKTFSNFFQFDPKLRKVDFGLSKESDLKSRAISGIMALVQNGVQGTFSIGLSKSAALKMLSAFYQEEISNLDDPKVVDAVAEIANVCHGLIKEKLNQQGFKFTMCLPMVAVGTNHSAFSSEESSALTLTFDSKAGEIIAEVIIHKKGA